MAYKFQIRGPINDDGSISGTFEGPGLGQNSPQITLRSQGAVDNILRILQRASDAGRDAQRAAIRAALGIHPYS